MESKFKSRRHSATGLTALLLCALTATAGPAALAQAVDQTVDQTGATSDSLQAEFDAALEAIDEARLRTARERLTSLLTANPSLSRARLELAKVYYLTRDYPAARAEARRVLDDPNTPPTVRATVLAFLAQIDADEKRFAARHQWAPSIYAGLMYDTNVNIGPSRDVIDIGGVLRPVLPEDRETSDFAAVISPGIVHTYNPNRAFDAGEQRGFFLWQSQANAYYRAYFDENDFNLGVLTLRTGPAWVVPGHWRAAIGLQGDQIFFGGDSLAFYTTLNPNLIFEVGDATEVLLDGYLTDRHYWDDDEDARDGLYSSANVLVTHYVANRKVGLQAGAGWMHFDADDDRFGYSGPDLLAGVLWEAWQGGLVYARVNYRGYDFDAVDPFFLVDDRDDDEWRYTVGFQHDFREGLLEKWSLIGNWIHTDNDSNVQVYEYDRDVINLGLARQF